MNRIIPLPPDVRHQFDQAYERCRQAIHPGLLLDKYVESWDEWQDSSEKWSETVQKPTVQRVAQLSRQAPTGFSFEQLLQRRRQSLEALGAVILRARTAGPLTLHLARASALENAGICLHHIYGFAYLPGTGLKGMARAYAETVWLPTRFQADENGNPADEAECQKATDAWRTIEGVFGWSPNSDHRKPWKPNGILPRENDDRSHVGQIVFHDAWPETWPRLVEDIVNNHHPKYYQGDDAPGDWDSPIPVYFLAVPAEQAFTFPLSKRRDDADEGLIKLAAEWLAGALEHQGAGAKTNAGYGSFRLEQTDVNAIRNLKSAADASWKSAKRQESRAEFACELELVTPAFLAGANQHDQDGEEAKEGCDLRPATLRGLLRWWWRTMHAGFVNVDTLRTMEAAIWGDTHGAGAVRLLVNSQNIVGPYLFDYKDGFDPKPEFKREHSLGDQPNKKTTQGLFYASYGMDDGPKQNPRRRLYLDVGSRWHVRLVAGPAIFFANRNDAADPKKRGRGITLSTHDVLAQAQAALWLLTRFGSVGSKARKGFGSIQVAESSFAEMSLDRCRFLGAELRQKLGLSNQFSERAVETAALAPPNVDWVKTIELPVHSVNPWQVLDHVGFAYQAVAQHYAHNPAKASLGLPRKIHGPNKSPIGHQKRSPHTHKRPEWLNLGDGKRDRNTKPQNARHASPVWIHVAESGEQHVVRAVAFAAPYLPNLNSSRKFLNDFMGRFEEALREPLRPSSQHTAGRMRQRSTPTRRPSESPQGHTDSRAAGLPAPGDRVNAELLEEKTKKEGWKAKHLASGISGPLQNSTEVPTDKEAGDKLELIVAYAKPDQIAFRYATAAHEQKPKKKKPGNKRRR